jgi:hypothetical protein
VRRWIGVGQRRLDRASLELCPLDHECTVGIRSRVPLRGIKSSPSIQDQTDLDGLRSGAILDRRW